MNYIKLYLILMCFLTSTYPVLTRFEFGSIEKINKITDKIEESLYPFLRNPFLIDFPDKKDISLEDYVYIQKKLREINIMPLLKKLYSETKNPQSFQEFVHRCSVGMNQKLINMEHDQIPVQKLEKIGSGGDCCIVSCAPYDNTRNILLKELIEQLHKTGFNGHIYYRIGGYPNPTGKEIKYCGVPYAIKIFMMMEAKNLGFNKVLWIDSSIQPLKNPSFLFDYIEKHGAIFHASSNSKENHKLIFHKTRKLLKRLSKKDPGRGDYVPGGIFGLDFREEKCRKFLQKYLSLVKRGTPFLSCRPEEFVFTSLLAGKDFKKCKKDLGLSIKFLSFEDNISFDGAVENGYYFFNRIHQDKSIMG